MLTIGYVIILQHSPGLHYNYFELGLCKDKEQIFPLPATDCLINLETNGSNQNWNKIHVHFTILSQLFIIFKDYTSYLHRPELS